jgi:hypothetical protein
MTDTLIKSYTPSFVRPRTTFSDYRAARLKPIVVVLTAQSAHAVVHLWTK